MNTPDYLDLVRKHLGLPSDYALQKPLGLSKSQLSAYRTGKESLSDATAVKVAELIGMDAGRVILDMHIERSKTPELRAVWVSLMDKLSVSFNGLLSGSWSGVERRRDWSRRLAHAR